MFRKASVVPDFKLWAILLLEGGQIRNWVGWHFFFGFVTSMYIKKPEHPLCSSSHFSFKVNLKI